MKSRPLSPDLQARLARMLLRARLAMEGALTGIHRSPQRGASIEFAEYKEYAPGDEIRHIDWRVYGRTDRYHVKQFEQETNLTCHLLLDASASMDYRSRGESKFTYAVELAAALAYLMLHQGDAVGLLSFDEKLVHYVPPRSGSAHLQGITETLVRLTPSGRTDIPSVLSKFAEKVHPRSMILLFSDLFDDPEGVIRALKMFRHRRHEILVFHILDPFERTFPFDAPTLFVDMEGEEKVLVDPKQIRTHYLAAIEAFIEGFRRKCRADRIDYEEVSTQTPHETMLIRYLIHRNAGQRRIR